MSVKLTGQQNDKYQRRANRLYNRLLLSGSNANCSSQPTAKEKIHFLLARDRCGSDRSRRVSCMRGEK